MDDARRRKLERKIPAWAGTDIEVPSGLNLEQCSSTATARYKAAVALRHILSVGTSASPSGQAGGVVADLTGGLGVDAYEFCAVARKVLYNDRDKALAEAVGRNFERLGVRNLEIMSSEVCASPRGDALLDGAIRNRLRGLQPDLIYLDPARRDAGGRKVFLPEDCSPDVLALLPELLALAPLLMVKFSPMMDITLLRRRLVERANEVIGRNCLKEIHVVGAEGECKELLAVLARDYSGEPELILHENGRILRASDLAGSASAHDNGSSSRVASGSGNYCTGGAASGNGNCCARWAASDSGNCSTGGAASDSGNCCTGGAASDSGDGRAGGSSSGCVGAYRAEDGVCADQSATLLFEPSAALLKSGLDAALAATVPQCRKLDRFTHLYYVGAPADRICAFGRLFEIVEELPLDKAGIKAAAKAYPEADVSARNVPLTSEQLRSRLGVRPAADIHIFGCTAAGERKLIVCRRR